MVTLRSGHVRPVERMAARTGPAPRARMRPGAPRCEPGKPVGDVDLHRAERPTAPLARRRNRGLHADERSHRRSARVPQCFATVRRKCCALSRVPAPHPGRAPPKPLRRGLHDSVQARHLADQLSGCAGLVHRLPRAPLCRPGRRLPGVGTRGEPRDSVVHVSVEGQAIHRYAGR